MEACSCELGPYDVTGDTGGNTLKYNPQNPIDVTLRGVIMGVSLIYDAKADMYSLDQTDKDDLDKLIETSRNASQSGTKQTKRHCHRNENMEDDGRRVTVITPRHVAEGRRSTRQQKAVTYDH